LQWVVENWVLVLFGGGMIAMHLFGHRGHGSKGGGGGCCGGKTNPKQKDSVAQNDAPDDDEQQDDIERE
jgi:hypothetical protein